MVRPMVESVNADMLLSSPPSRHSGTGNDMRRERDAQGLCEGLVPSQGGGGRWVSEQHRLDPCKAAPPSVNLNLKMFINCKIYTT